MDLAPKTNPCLSTKLLLLLLLLILILPRYNMYIWDICVNQNIYQVSEPPVSGDLGGPYVEGVDHFADRPVLHLLLLGLSRTPQALLAEKRRLAPQGFWSGKVSWSKECSTRDSWHPQEGCIQARSAYLSTGTPCWDLIHKDQGSRKVSWSNLAVVDRSGGRRNPMEGGGGGGVGGAITRKPYLDGTPISLFLENTYQISHFKKSFS